MVLPPDVLARARRQDGVISRRQILALGHREGQVDGWVHRRRLVPVQRGVYRIPGGAWRPEQDAMAAVLRCAPGARAAGPLVLGMLGVHEVEDDRFTILTQPGRRVRNVRFPIARDPLPGRFFARFRELPIVTGPLAVLEAGRVSGGESFLAAIDAARWAGLADTDQIVDLAGELVRHRGAVQARRFHREGLLDLESGGERRLDHVLARLEGNRRGRCGLPPTSASTSSTARTSWSWSTRAGAITATVPRVSEGNRHRSSPRRTRDDTSPRVPREAGHIDEISLSTRSSW